MLEKRGIFGIAMLDSQRCLLGEVVPLPKNKNQMLLVMMFVLTIAGKGGTIQLITYTPGFVSSMLGNKVKDLIPNVGFSW